MAQMQLFFMAELLEITIVGYNFFVLILIMYILSIIFQYIFGNSDKDKAG